jgi:aryl-alcohol dehydrogenase-like predicted oxidoreductase
MPLPTRKLGRTGLDVSVLGFGGAPLGADAPTPT